MWILAVAAALKALRSPPVRGASVALTALAEDDRYHGLGRPRSAVSGGTPRAYPTLADANLPYKHSRSGGARRARQPHAGFALPCAFFTASVASVFRRSGLTGERQGILSAYSTSEVDEYQRSGGTTKQISSSCEPTTARLGVFSLMQRRSDTSKRNLNTVPSRRARNRDGCLLLLSQRRSRAGLIRKMRNSRTFQELSMCANPLGRDQGSDAELFEPPIPPRTPTNVVYGREPGRGERPQAERSC